MSPEIGVGVGAIVWLCAAQRKFARPWKAGDPKIQVQQERHVPAVQVHLWGDNVDGRSIDLATGPISMDLSIGAGGRAYIRSYTPTTPSNSRVAAFLAFVYSGENLLSVTDVTVYKSVEDGRTVYNAQEHGLGFGVGRGDAQSQLEAYISLLLFLKEADLPLPVDEDDWAPLAAAWNVEAWNPAR